MLLYRTVELCGVEMEIEIECDYEPPCAENEMNERFVVEGVCACDSAALRKALARPLRKSWREDLEDTATERRIADAENKNLFGGMNAGITE